MIWRNVSLSLTKPLVEQNLNLMKKLIHFEAAILVMAILLISIACEKEEVKQQDLTDARPEVYEDPSELQSMPEYKGGNTEFLRFIQQNIKYPKAARESGTEGKIYVSFIIDKTGEITHVQTEKYQDADGDEIVVVGYAGENSVEIKNKNVGVLLEEAVRVIKASKEWSPGMKDGHPVNVRMTIPINFKLG